MGDALGKLVGGIHLDCTCQSVCLQEWADLGCEASVDYISAINRLIARRQRVAKAE